MACILAAALMACASSAHAQVIEEDGFPVKGDGVWGEPFSLSCPSRLVAGAGESVLFSCAVTSVPEEGVRYEWESLSGEGLRLLSDANERSPLFTAPVSGEGSEYVYRLTAMSVGVYETATVSVSVEGASGGKVRAPVVREECDPLTIPDELGEGCAEGKGLVPFGFGPESEGGLFFPEAPGLPDRPSGPARGGGLDRQMPPRLECPVAVFLEEMETGQVECHAWGASGEEYLDFAWEPVGSTTRDYLDNPRLIPEDAPNPLVVAPEVPAHETLESFRSGDRAFRYRYRLTVTSRTTGLSSSSEVEVYVSSSRPSVYCPLEVAVEEGETVSLDCEGVDPLSLRLDYDEDEASVLWEWEGLWGTSMAPLDATDLSSPLFTAPLGSAGEEYHYIASMTSSASGISRTARRRVTVRVEGAEGGASGPLDNLICIVFPPVYEGDPDRRFQCQVRPSDGERILSETWTWEHSYDPGILSAANVRDPFFRVPDSVSETTRYDFRVRVDYRLSLSGNRSESQDAYVTVRNLEVVVECEDPGSVQEGAANIAFSCSARHRGGSGGITWSWSPTTRLMGHDTGMPTFAAPSEVDRDTTFTYTVTASVPDHDPDEETITVKVRNTDTSAPSVRCENASIYEGAGDITLDCTVVNEPSGATYVWSGTDVASRLSGTDGYAPVFSAPGDIDEPGEADKNYEYTVTMSADGIADIVEDVRVTVLEKPNITWCGAHTFSDYAAVWEGSGDTIESSVCSAGDTIVSPEGAPGGDYSYWWSVRGGTPETAIDLLHSRTGMAASFSIPPYGTLDEDRTYEYRLAISAPNADAATWNWTVTVKNSVLVITCDDPDPVYEGSPPFDFSCFVTGPPGLTYVWSWSPADRLTDRDTGTPTFAVPAEVDRDTTWTYAARVTTANAGPDPDEETVTVTVLNKGTLSVACADPPSVYEGSEDVVFDCEASGAPADSDYTYTWEAGGDTQDTSLLSAADTASPMFYVPDALDETTTYEYLLTASAENAESGSAEVTVTVLNRGALSVVCVDPPSVYEGSEDFALDCAASGAPAGSAYEYAWTAIGSTTNTALLSAADVSSPTFYVPEEVEEDETYEYLLAVSAANAESGSAEVTVTVLNRGALSVVCVDPPSVYEGSEDFALDCAASGAPAGSAYEYAWTAIGATTNTDLLSGADIASPTFYVPDALDETTTYEYLLTASAENAESGSAEVTVTVLNRGALSVVCVDPPSVYEGSEDFALDCTASGAPAGSAYEYAWTAIGATTNTDLLSATDVSSPVFYVPEEVDEDETYEYLLTVSAENAESGSAEVTVTVLDRIRTPAPDPVSPPAEEPPADPLPPVAESSSRAPSDPTALGVTVSASPLRFGVQSSQTGVSLDPLTDGISTRVSGPYHAGRMTLSPGGGASFDENGEMDLSIEVVAPVLLKREGAAEPSSLVLSPSWSFAESCEQLSSQAIGGLYTEATLTEGACRLLRFGGELDLAGAPSGRYAGAMDVVLRSGEREETHSVEVEVTVVPAQRVITIGPGGVRFSTSREVPAGLTEDQSLSIYPDVAFLTEGKPNGAFELSNPSLIPLEVSVSARFGYTEATEDGREVVVEDVEDSPLGDLSQVVDIYPSVLVLMPGEKGLVRYGVEEGALASMSEQGYAAFFDVVSEPRQYVRSDRMPEEVSGERTARVTMSVPGVYVPGEVATQLRAALLSLSYGVSMSATFLMETGGRPFVGEVVAFDGDGRELGRRETLVYTRSRVRVLLDRIPEEGAVFLRFVPRGSGRASEPAPVRWNAPGRDIGAAGERP